MGSGSHLICRLCHKSEKETDRVLNQDFTVILRDNLEGLSVKQSTDN